jgi:hypothetical protein
MSDGLGTLRRSEAVSHLLVFPSHVEGQTPMTPTLFTPTLFTLTLFTLTPTTQGVVGACAASSTRVMTRSMLPPSIFFTSSSE